MTLTSHAQITKLGDINHDNQVDISDVVALVNIVLNGYTPFSVSPTEVTLQVGGTANVPIFGGYYFYKVESANPGVVTASLNGFTITLSAVAGGETTVTVRDVLTFRTIDIPVVVTVEDNQPQSYLTCPDSHHPHLIDLGLPSGTLWSCCNVGADKPEAYGGYYAWGETEEKDYYDWSTYIHCNGSESTCHNLGFDIAGTQYDVAHVKWGGSWVMPSIEQIDELINNCTYEWTTVNGVKGHKFISKTNGGSIFLPAAGNRWPGELGNTGSDGYYWSSSLDESSPDYAWGLFFVSGYVDTSNINRIGGQSVRPVR